MASCQTELLLLPGLDGTGRLFKRLERALAGRVKTRVMSYPANPACGYPELIALVEGDLGAEPIVVLGESFSGPIAIEIALRHPEQVKGLVLSATFAQSPWPSWLVKAAAGVDVLRIPAALRNRFLRGSRVDPELDAEIADVLASMPAGVRASRLRQVAAIDVRDDLSSQTCPILALHGTRDFVVPRFPLKAALRGKANVRLSEFECGHLLLQTFAGQAATDIAAFVQNTERNL